ncbi:MAG: hypothetical protein SOY28_13150 [Roseburia sp.]|nr:hypothetical protein [Roseburia sp.]
MKKRMPETRLCKKEKDNEKTYVLLDWLCRKYFFVCEVSYPEWNKRKQHFGCNYNTSGISGICNGG